MILFDLIKKYEDRILLRAEKITEKRLMAKQKEEGITAEQETQEKIEIDQQPKINPNPQAKRLEVEEQLPTEIEPQDQYAQRLLNSRIPKEFIICVTHGPSEALLSIYFLSKTPRAEMIAGQNYKVIKITGNNFGKKYVLKVEKGLWANRYKIDVDGEIYSGIINEPWLSAGFKTIRDLNRFINKDNNEQIKKYNEWVVPDKEQQEIAEGFFK